jgi:hypothetical protein
MSLSRVLCTWWWGRECDAGARCGGAADAGGSRNVVAGACGGVTSVDPLFRWF